MLYFEIRPSLKRLSDEEKGRLFEAILDYGENGTAPGFDGALGIVWDFIQPRIDADSQRYQKVSEARSAAAAARWEQKNMQTNANDANAFFAMQTMPTTTTTTTTTSSSTERVAPGETAAPADGQKPDRKKYGQYGWVMLTESDYNRLLNDFGQPEVERCIAYVDESAQMTRNKNKWRDWALTIRRCAREGWGLRQGKATATADSAADARDDMRRMEKYLGYLREEKEKS